MMAGTSISVRWAAPSSSIIHCARELARRGHNVTVHTPCIEVVEHESVLWKPLNHPPQAGCDLYVAVQQPRLLGFVRRPKRRAIWVLWPSNQLRHYKKIGRMWRYRPVPVLESRYQVERYSRLLPGRDRQIIIPLGLADDVRGRGVSATVPVRRAIFASNPQRNLRRLVEIWATFILPRVPDAVLDVFGINALRSGEDAWKSWEGGVLPHGLPQYVKEFRPGSSYGQSPRSHRGDASLPNDPVSWSQVRSVLPVTRGGAGPGVTGGYRACGGATGARHRRRYRISSLRPRAICASRGLTLYG